MDYEVVVLEKQVVKGISVRTSNESGVGEVDIPKVWNDFYSNVYSTIENKLDNKVIGMYFDYESDHTSLYTFMPCVAVCDLNGTIDTKEIKAGKYAKFSVHGDINEVVYREWLKIWEMNLDRDYQTDFELYHMDTDNPSIQTVDIYISIK